MQQSITHSASVYVPATTRHSCVPSTTPMEPTRRMVPPTAQSCDNREVYRLVCTLCVRRAVAEEELAMPRYRRVARRRNFGSSKGGGGSR